MATYPQTDLEKKAWDFAKNAHQGVRRKFGDVSYFDGHVRKVFGLVKQFDTRAELGAASLLHDCIEDVDEVTYEILVEEFGKIVANLVKELTSCEEMLDVMGKPDYLLDKMMVMSSDALIIKLCDRLQNISDFYRASEKFRLNYYKETRYIMDKLASERQLNGAHRRIVEQINGLLESSNNKYQYEGINLKYLESFGDFEQIPSWSEIEKDEYEYDSEELETYTAYSKELQKWADSGGDEDYDGPMSPNFYKKKSISIYTRSN